MTRWCWMVAALCALVPASARADGWISPFFGVNLGGAVPQDEQPKTYGLSAGSMGRGVFGFETEVSFSPDFFGKSDNLLVGDNSVFTWMGNVIIGAPVGGQSGPGVRPFVTGGLGLIRRHAQTVTDLASLSLNNFGYDVGAGLMLFVSKSFGFRGDYRYYRNFQSSDLLPGLTTSATTFNFSRASGAIVLRF